VEEDIAEPIRRPRLVRPKPRGREGNSLSQDVATHAAKRNVTFKARRSGDRNHRPTPAIETWHRDPALSGSSGPAHPALSGIRGIRAHADRPMWHRQPSGSARSPRCSSATRPPPATRQGQQREVRELQSAQSCDDRCAVGRGHQNLARVDVHGESRTRQVWSRRAAMPPQIMRVAPIAESAWQPPAEPHRESAKCVGGKPAPFGSGENDRRGACTCQR
jgi:hypothetical protein